MKQNTLRGGEIRGKNQHIMINVALEEMIL